ncbi:MAG: M56 family metallopeptidase, partial [Pirellulales bacterium]
QTPANEASTESPVVPPASSRPPQRVDPLEGQPIVAVTDLPLRDFVHWTGEAGGAPESAPTAVRTTPTPTPATLPGRAPSWREMRGVLFALYLGGVAAMVALLALHALRVRRELRASATWSGDPSAGVLRDFAGRKVAVRSSATAAAPYSSGLWRPVIVVPAALLESLSPAAWRAVLAHESAHHRRGDLWVNALQKAVLALWWWHPLVWLLDRRLSQVREECCDDAALAEGLPAADYCATLLDIAGFATQKGRRVDLTVGLGASHALAARFRQIMDLGRVRRTRLGFAGWIGLAALAALLLPGLPSRATAQNEQPDPPTAEKPASPAVPAAAKRALAGRVVDRRNRAVDEAQVWAIAVPESRQGILLGAGRTNDRGEFRLELSADPPAGVRETQFALVAFAGEQGVGGFAQPATLPTGAVLTLDQARHTQLEFREPSGAPAIDVSAGPASLQLNDRWISLPNDVSAALAGVSNAQGQATVWGIGPAEYGSFLVNRADLGEQHLTLDEKAPRTALTVTPAGRVEGRVLLPPGVTPEQLGSRLQVHTNWAPGINHTPHWLGSAE